MTRYVIIAISLTIIAGGFIFTALNGSQTRDLLAALTVASAQPSTTLTPPAARLPDRALSTSGLLEPIADFRNRITKKPFGIYITPETSPVQPDRFTGYHTGVDVEYDDVAGDVPVRAIADGTITVSAFASGYGGVIVIRHDIDGRPLLALYGHLDPTSLVAKNTRVSRGQVIAILGDGETHETDGVRKHLHFGLRIDETADLHGYVKSPEELGGWLDPLQLYR